MNVQRSLRFSFLVASCLMALAPDFSKTAEPAPRHPAVDLTRDFTPFDLVGSQGALYLDNKDPNVLVKIFDKVPDVSQAQIQELVRINERLRARGVPVAPLEPVRTVDGTWGVRMPLVQGEALPGVLNILSAGAGASANAAAAALRDEAVWALDRIDAVTVEETGAKLADRPAAPLGGERGLANFIVVRDGSGRSRVVNVDPIDMRALQSELAGCSARASGRLAAASGFIE